jgi:preprotein translocase subunit Sec61beta
MEKPPAFQCFQIRTGAIIAFENEKNQKALKLPPESILKYCYDVGVLFLIIFKVLLCPQYQIEYQIDCVRIQE